MAKAKAKGNKRNRNVERPYNTRSRQMPLPSMANTAVPPVRGQRTGRFARQARKFGQKKKNMTLEAALRDETKFYSSRLKHLVQFTNDHTYICKGVTLDNLRSRDAKADKPLAVTRFSEMLASGMIPHQKSGVWLDDSSKAEWLVIYAAQHQDENGKVYQDGFMQEEANHMVEVTQSHINILGISAPPLDGDQRHQKSAEYPFLDYDILSDDEEDVEKVEHRGKSYVDPISQADISESIGLRHDIHCWHEQGHKHDDPLPSVDLRGKASGEAARTARSYISATAPQQKYLDMLLKTYAPVEYEKLKKSAEAGRWYAESTEGCTLGLATVWKLQVAVHLDAKDYELCMITCGGNFTGGHLYLPDLNLCLVYKPGDVVIFRSPYLFHAIGPWKPGPMLPEDACTPGRVSWVHFTHADVHNKLVDKPPGFFLSGGQFEGGSLVVENLET